MTDAEVRKEWRPFMQASSRDGTGASLKAKRAKAALRGQEPQVSEQRRILILRGRGKYDRDVSALKSGMTLDMDESRVMSVS